MNLFLKSELVLSLCIFVVFNDDPDIECLSPNISADDGQAYVFSGHYYWKLNLKSGISKGYAKLINRWSRAPTDMDAAFTVADQNQGFSTVFIKEDKCIHIESINFCNQGIQVNAFIFQNKE